MSLSFIGVSMDTIWSITFACRAALQKALPRQLTPRLLTKKRLRSMIKIPRRRVVGGMECILGSRE